MAYFGPIVSWRSLGSFFAPARFVAMLADKAEGAGGRLVTVDPRWTSRCGCGTVLDRDVNAAPNILAKAVVGLEGTKQALARSP
jgi:transposase